MTHTEIVLLSIITITMLANTLVAIVLLQTLKRIDKKESQKEKAKLPDNKKFEKAYCENCDEDVDFNTHEKTRVATIKNIKVEYLHTIATCEICGGRVYPVSVGKLNDKIKYETFNKLLDEQTKETENN